ncbi:MAG: hypothetical protein PHF74_02800 [Dehalococcoidales bacterium]|nr:hypothetical protein [Dehalococcoidales bacterium]
MYGSGSQYEKIPNPVKHTAIIWWIICGICLILIFSPAIFELAAVEAGDWIFALMFFAIVFGITAFIVAIMYTKRASLTGQMLQRNNLLAYWTYTTEQWNSYAVKEHEENKREKRNMFVLISVISIVICAILALIIQDGWYIFLFVALGIIVLMAFTAWLSVWTRYRQNQKYPGDTYICADGIYFNRELHVWRGFGAILEDVAYQQDAVQPQVLITYSVLNRYNRQYVTIRVPVPRGRENEALNLVQVLRGQSSQGQIQQPPYGF